VCMASTKFADAAEAQGQPLGLQIAAVFVPHPIQDGTDHEMEGLADAAFDQIVGAITTYVGGFAAKTSAPALSRAAGSCRLSSRSQTGCEWLL
jgi:hypothetical protein